MYISVLLIVWLISTSMVRLASTAAELDPVNFWRTKLLVYESIESISASMPHAITAKSGFFLPLAFCSYIYRILAGSRLRKPASKLVNMHCLSN